MDSLRFDGLPQKFILDDRFQRLLLVVTVSQWTYKENGVTVRFISHGYAVG